MSVSKKKQMSGILDKIRSQLEDALFQWNRKEEEYLTVIRQLQEENAHLTASMEELRQELEFITKQFDDCQSKEKKLVVEIEKLRLDNAILDTSRSRKKWGFFL